MNAGTQGPASLLGRVIGGYRLVSVLGKGATGVVFLGERTDEARQILERTGREPIVLPEQAAVKVLILPWQLDDAERAEFRRRFVREAQTLQRLRHPNILPVLISGEDDATGSSFMVLPYVPGGTLHERLAAQGPLPLAEASAILAQLAAAIDFAHQSHVLHRDIKPGNILLGDDGQAYLSDFSIARLLSETTTHLTKTGNALGTPIYMPPEALAGQPVGAAGDIFSLGMVLYEMVTGLRTAITNPPAPARMMRPDLPPPAEAAIQMATDANPAQRPASASALAEDFGAGIEGRWAPGLTQYVAGTRRATVPPVAVYGAAPTSQPWPVASTTRQRRGHPVMGTLLVGAVTLLVVSCFALAASNRAGLMSIFGGGHGTPGIGSAHGTPSPSARTSQASATSGQSNGGAGPAPTNTPQIIYVGNTPQPTDTLAPGITPTPTDTPTDTPTPTLTPTPVVLSGNVADQASLSPGGTGAVIDENLSTQWIGGHGSASTITFSWPVPVTIHRIVVWDRPQDSPDNNQINLLGVSLSDGTVNQSIDMVSGGPRCANITLVSDHTVTWVRIYPWDSSGNNGYSEIEIWATTGPQSSGLYCSNSRTM